MTPINRKLLIAYIQQCIVEEWLKHLIRLEIQKNWNEVC